MSNQITPEDHLKNRQWMVAALAGEIYGPGGRYSGWQNELYKQPEEIAVTDGYVFPSWDEYNLKRHVQAGSKEEILKEEAPTKRYGVGLLFPDEAPLDDTNETSLSEDSDAALEAASGVLDEALKGDNSSGTELQMAADIADKCKRLAGLAGRDLDSDDDSVTGQEDEADALQLARMRRPRSMGITFAVDVTNGPLNIVIEGARYRRFKVEILGKEGKEAVIRDVWARVPIRIEWALSPNDLKPVSRHSLSVDEIAGLAPIDLALDIRIRAMPEMSDYPTSARLITVTLVNSSSAARRDVDKLTLYQSRFSVFSGIENGRPFLPLPRIATGNDEEEASLALLYRSIKTFSIGHGCTGDWETDEKEGSALCVIAEPMPVHETPQVTANLVYPKEHPRAGQRLTIQMLPLARQEAGWNEPLEELVDLYDSWIEEAAKELENIKSPRLRKAGDDHVGAARKCLARMKEGLALLDDPGPAEAFRFTNEAILLQQIAGRQGLRAVRFDGTAKKWLRDQAISVPTMEHSAAEECSWRPFQIAFLLMSLPGLWDGSHHTRPIADLIWFPTGGGKTEAYLGAAAFYLISRRLQDSDDAGTGVLMRYTLRLLTSQQFQRAAGLICALERIRERERQLGEKAFGIGIWVGGGTTPNSRKQSLEALHEAEFSGPDAYQHVLLRCPWCSSQMGPVRNPSRQGKKFVCHGLATSGSGSSRSVLIHCPDQLCAFHNELPVKVVDEELYIDPPSLVIGTVDKFAMLAWKPDARALFGIGADGHHHVSPPGLIIQDELHLITGPLGSMVGLYEGVIEELCTDRRGPHAVIPKLIASTATTRASTRQVSDLYAREETAIFPPPGLDASDSFFATYDKYEDGTLKPGRMYIGVLARAYGSGLTVNVRVFAALLAAAHLVPPAERDPWYTLLVFHNSLRELGAGLTLYGADVPERLAELRNRWIPGERRRFLNEVLELTGRLENSEVPRALEALERRFPDKKVVDACLASNIIEVGVDVPRLGLMAVSGQPKNTAQYIQATGRVGRVFPGLVFMVYDNRKARDLSHYEHFKDYHGRLYAAVEPASVTPFTTQVVERALHGAFIAWVRTKIDRADEPDPRRFGLAEGPMRNAVKEFYKCFKRRIEFLFRNDGPSLLHAQETFKRMMNRRADEWSAWTQAGAGPCAVVWSNKDLTGDSGDQPLLRQYGQACKEAWTACTWPTPTSMRGVDAECPADIVHHILAAVNTQNSTEMFD